MFLSLACFFPENGEVPETTELVSVARLTDPPAFSWGRLHGQSGDWTLNNDVVTAVFDSPVNDDGVWRRRLAAPGGGTLLDFGPIGGADHLTQVFQAMDHRPGVGVLYQGLESADAGLVLEGVVFDPRQELGLPLSADGSVAGVTVTTTWSMVDGQRFVRGISELSNNAGVPLNAGPLCDVLVLDGAGGIPFLPSVDGGFDATVGLRAHVPWVGVRSQGEPAATFGVVSPQMGSLQAMVHEGADGAPSMVTVCMPPGDTLVDDGSTLSFERQLVTTTGNDIGDLSHLVYPMLADTRSSAIVASGLSTAVEVVGTVSPPDTSVVLSRLDPAIGLSASGVEEDLVVPLVAATGDDEGFFELALPPGTYGVTSSTEGVTSGEVVLVEDGGDLNLELEDSRHGVRFSAAGPVRIGVFGTGDTPDPDLGLSVEGASLNVAGNRIWTVLGEADVVVPAGDYLAVFSRGPLSEVDEVPFSVPQDALVQGVVAQVVDPRGFSSLDPAVQSSASLGGTSAFGLVQSAALCEGLAGVGQSDVDLVASDQPSSVEAFAGSTGRMDLPRAGVDFSEGWWTSLPGTEHPSSGWHPADWIAHAMLEGADVVMLHHPRSTSEEHTGLFVERGYDPAQGLDAAMFQERATGGIGMADLTHLEVLSAHAPGTTEAVLQDWVALLNAGARIYPGASSLAADLRADTPGSARMWLPAKSPSDLLDVMARGEGFVSTGPMLDVTAHWDGVSAPPGGTLDRSTGNLTLDVVVSAAPWVPVTSLWVQVGSTQVVSLSIPASQDEIRLVDTLQVPISEGANWVWVAVGDPDTLPDGTFSRVYPDVPSFAVTSPIWIEE